MKGVHMKGIQHILDFIDNVNEWTGRISCVAVLVLTFIVAYEVIMRKFFANPSIWSYDVSKQIYAFHFFLLAGYTLLHNRHVAVDVLSRKLPERIRTIVDLICYLIFFFPFWFVMLWFGVKFSAASWRMLEIGRDVFQIPLYPIKTIIPFATLLILLQGISSFVKKLSTLKRGITHD
jgi:TRAP-type mannitol/chloroaromatic compound transport system permease small subunit